MKGYVFPTGVGVDEKLERLAGVWAVMCKICLEDEK